MNPYPSCFHISLKNMNVNFMEALEKLEFLHYHTPGSHKDMKNDQNCLTQHDVEEFHNVLSL